MLSSLKACEVYGDKQLSEQAQREHVGLDSAGKLVQFAIEELQASMRADNSDDVLFWCHSVEKRSKQLGELIAVQQRRHRDPERK